MPDLSLPALDRETVGSPVRRSLVRGAAALAGAGLAPALFLPRRARGASLPYVP